jgi:hypothetical protein
MIIYLDDQYLVHTSQNGSGTLAPWSDDAGFFAGKCAAFIEGFRVVPDGQAWTRSDGAVFHGLMISPAADPIELNAYQVMADQETIATLDAVVVDLTYQNILLELGV